RLLLLLERSRWALASASSTLAIFASFLVIFARALVSRFRSLGSWLRVHFWFSRSICFCRMACSFWSLLFSLADFSNWDCALFSLPWALSWLLAALAVLLSALSSFFFQASSCCCTTALFN